MSNINYSIIIPHKNSPLLLNRCLESIPRRDDIQIIVVDDNSSEELVDFDNFPGKNDSRVELYFNKIGRGAGNARNLGLKKANGKWLLFADSDDTYITDRLSEMMGKYVDSPADIVFFDVECIDSSSGLHINSLYDQYHKYIRDCSGDRENRCRYYLRVPWGKFVKRDLVFSNNINFSETKVANDILFSVYAGYYAKDIVIDANKIYNYYYGHSSLTKNRSYEAIYTHYKAAVTRNRFLESKSLSAYRYSLFDYIPAFIRADKHNINYLKFILQDTPIQYLIKDVFKSLRNYIKRIFRRYEG